MALSELLDGDERRYLETHRDQPGALWLFLHIPKTAGSSFRAELAWHLQPDRNIVVDYEDQSVPYHEQLQRLVADFADNMEGVRFASGHIFRSHAELLRQHHPDLRMITMLRDPVARLVSEYRYARTPAHPSYRDFIREFPTFADYVDSPASQNKMFEFLRLRPEDTVDEVIRDLEGNLVFLGVTEMYYLSCRVLFTLLGHVRNPTVYDRRTERSADNQVDGLVALTPRIRAVNAKDVAIYDHFYEKLRRRRERIRRALWS